jgi:3-dehydroquinate dehydratase/shikimate dehydrogenase
MVQVEIQEAGRRGARMIDLHLDFLAKAPDFKRLLANKPCPIVATVRRPEDGGRWPGTEEARLMLLRQAVAAGFDWVDVETDVADKVSRFRDVQRIVSYHNLREMPADLELIYDRMCNQDADVVMMEVRAQQPSDNLRVLELVKKKIRPTVAFCLGDMGFPSRILGAKFGAPFTYGAFNKERGIAPGLPSYDELRHIYHYDRVNSETRVYGLIGDPVAHNLSPVLHNAVLRSQRLNAVYLPFRVPRGELEGFVNQFDILPVQGYSVTIPHKEDAAALAQQREPSVVLTEAANTLVRTGSGFSVYNTEYGAALEALLAHMKPGTDGAPPTLHSRAVLVLGAGGLARSVAHGLHREGALVTISGRTYDRAHELAEEIGCRAVDWAARHSVLCDVLVNCTPVGTQPNVDESPVHPGFLKPGLVVFDTVYTPETTLLIKEAQERGCPVVTGVDLFIRQAAAQFRLFAGQEPPLEFMRTVLRRAISPVSLKAPEELNKNQDDKPKA